MLVRVSINTTQGVTGGQLKLVSHGCPRGHPRAARPRPPGRLQEGRCPPCPPRSPSCSAGPLGHSRAGARPRGSKDLQEWPSGRGQSQRGTPSCARSSREGRGGSEQPLTAPSRRGPRSPGQRAHGRSHTCHTPLIPHLGTTGQRGSTTCGSGRWWHHEWQRTVLAARVPGRVRKTYLRVFYLLLGFFQQR